MKKIIALAIIVTVGVFAGACANSTTANTGNTTSNKNAANANSMGNGEHRGNMNMMNSNHSGMENRRMQ